MKNLVISNSKILITGGAGFIGSSLADFLIQHNNKITIVDDMSMGRYSNIPECSNVQFFKESITNYNFMEKLMVKENFDYIYMFAGIASVADSINRPYITHLVNQEANICILEIIRINNLQPKKIIFASSAAVYGDNPQLPKSEESMICPLTPYAIDKYASERYVINYGKLYNISTLAVRFFNVYGPKQNPESPYSGVISILTECLANNKIFTLYGNGEQIRDFVYIDDVIKALIILSLSNQAIHDVYNIASGNAYSLIEVITAYERIAGKRIYINTSDSRKGDIMESYADITKLRNLGYIPRYSLSSGLYEYWKYLN